MELFDTHAHYDDEHFDGDRDALLSSMGESGVRLILNPGCDLETSRRAVALAEQYPFVYAAVGFHPGNCHDFDAARDIPALRELAKHPKVVALGEMGLDYYWESNPPRDFQQQVFRAQLELSLELSLPVIIHDREAHGDTLAVLADYPAVHGVFHCFSGSAEMARELAGKGWYLGFDGPVTYKNARRNLEAAAAIPLDRLVLETDSPYLTPIPLRGKRNSSHNLHLIAEKLAQVLELEPEALAAQCMENGRRLFGLE